MFAQLLAVVISHNHFDHFAYVVNLIEAVKERVKSRSFPLIIFLPASLFQYYTSLYQSQLQSMPVRFVPITDSLLRQSTPLSFFHPTHAVMPSFNSSQAQFNISQNQFNTSQTQMQLLQNLSIRFVRNNHNSQSYAVVRCLLRA